MAQAVQVAKPQTSAPEQAVKPASRVDPYQDLSKISLNVVENNLRGLASREQFQRENARGIASYSYSSDMSPSELGNSPSTTAYANRSVAEGTSNQSMEPERPMSISGLGNSPSTTAYANRSRTEGTGNQSMEPEQPMSMQSYPSSPPLQQVHKTPLGNLMVERGETKSNAKGQKYNDYTIRVPDGYDLQADETIEQLSTGKKKTLDNSPTIYGTDDPNVFKVRVHQGNKYGLHLVGNGRGSAGRGEFLRDRNGKKATLPICNYPELEGASKNQIQEESHTAVPPISTCVSEGSASKSRSVVIDGKNFNLYSIRILPGMVIEPELRIQRLADRAVLERDKTIPVIYSDPKDPNIIQIAIPQGFRYQFHIRNGYSGQVLRNRNGNISTFSITNLPRMP